jgi:hypothetical protein
MNDLDKLMKNLVDFHDKANEQLQLLSDRVTALEEPAMADRPTERDRLIELISAVRTVNEMNGSGGSRVQPEWLDRIKEEFSL